MHLMQVRHRFLVSCGASRRCPRASAAVCSQEEITSTSTCVRAATAVVVNSSRTRLRAPSTLSVSHLANHEPTRLAFLLHTTWSITSEGLRHVSSSTQAVVRAHCMFDDACTSSWNFLLTASSSVWNRLLIKLPSSISRTISVRRRRDRVESSCFSLSVRTKTRTEC